MNDRKCLYIPREINKPYVFIWKKDEVIFLILPFLLFFIIGGLLGFLLTLIGIIATAIFIKNLSVDKPSGYILHWLRYHIPKKVNNSIFRRNDAFPPTHIRHIAG